MNKLPLLLALALVLPAPVRADDDDLLTRDEVSAFKKTLVSVLDALGAPPSGFAKDKDDFSLPTNWSKSDGKIQAVQASANRRLAIKGVADAEKNSKQLGQDYQKKMLEAQAKGDYAEMSRLAQEVSAKSGQNALAGVNAQQEKKEPISLSVQLNLSVDEGIDPDNVVVEKPGVLGLKSKNGGEDDPKETVRLYFQPTALKDTKKMSRVRLFSNGSAVPAKTSVGTVVVELTGPAADVEAWAKRVNAAKILALVNAPAK